MDSFTVLYRFEMKKLMQKKILWVSLIICLAAIVFSIVFPLLGTYVVNGTVMGSNYEQHLIDQAHRKALDGRPIDQALLQETMEAYRHVPTNVTPYSATEEYQTYARPYSEVFRLIRAWTGMDTGDALQWEPDEAELYAAWSQQAAAYRSGYYLSSEESAYWEAKAAAIEMPLTYQYHDGWGMIIEVFLTVGVMMLLYTAIVLAGVFPDEHSRRTDQLILCTVHGRSSVYTAKLAAGITAGFGGSLLMTLTAVGLSLTVYGSEGFGTPVQIYISHYAAPLPLGEACLIAYAVLLITAVLMSVFVMLLSELLGSGIAALSVTTGLILAGSLITVPAHYRSLSQIWDSLPTTYLAVWNIFDCRLVPIPGGYALSYVTVPAIYLLCAALLAAMGKRIYARYQVTGR